MSAVKIAVFLPKKRQNSDPTLMKMPLANRMPNKEIEGLLSLLVNSGKFELTEISSLDELIVLNDEVLYKGGSLNDLDIFFWYGGVGRGGGTYYLDILKALSHKVKVIPNPYSFEAGLDKYLAHTTLKKCGVNVSDLILLSHRNLHLAQPILDEWGYGLLKPRKGGFGKGVTLIDSFSMLRDIVEYAENIQDRISCEGVLLERYYENDVNEFVSSVLIDGQVVYGYRKNTSRRAILGNGQEKIYDANAMGGEVDICEVGPEHQEQSLRAYKALGAEVIGFDMVWHNGRPIVVDENTFPGLYTDLFAQQGISLAQKMYELILNNSPLADG